MTHSSLVRRVFVFSLTPTHETCEMCEAALIRRKRKENASQAADLDRLSGTPPAHRCAPSAPAPLLPLQRVSSSASSCGDTTGGGEMAVVPDKERQESWLPRVIFLSQRLFLLSPASCFVQLEHRAGHDLCVHVSTRAAKSPAHMHSSQSPASRASMRPGVVSSS